MYYYKIKVKSQAHMYHTSHYILEAIMSNSEKRNNAREGYIVAGREIVNRVNNLLTKITKLQIIKNQNINFNI